MSGLSVKVLSYPGHLEVEGMSSDHWSTVLVILNMFSRPFLDWRVHGTERLEGVGGTKTEGL